MSCEGGENLSDGWDQAIINRRRGRKTFFREPNLSLGRPRADNAVVVCKALNKQIPVETPRFLIEGSAYTEVVHGSISWSTI
jgi:hypothetical protein